MNYTLREMMAVVAAREIKNEDIVFCGTGISIMAAMAAKHIHAPNSVIFFETGAIDSFLEEIPVAVGDSRVMYRAIFHGGLSDAFSVMQNRFIVPKIIGILGAAQIDAYGNLNSTVIGDYWRPQKRFAGSGGACDVASFVSRSIIFMQLLHGRFVEKLDYLTSPGYINEFGGREHVGLRPGGPVIVVTDKAVFRFNKQTNRMFLAGYYPKIKKNEVLEVIDFHVETDEAIEVPPPTREELNVLRKTCDPQCLIL